MFRRLLIVLRRLLVVLLPFLLAVLRPQLIAFRHRRQLVPLVQAVSVPIVITSMVIALIALMMGKIGFVANPASVFLILVVIIFKLLLC